jgi:hypothetical protein
VASLVSDAHLAVGIGVVSRFVGRFLENWTRILGMALSPGFRIFSSGSLILHRRAYVIGMILSRKIVALGFCRGCFLLYFGGSCGGELLKGFQLFRICTIERDVHNDNTQLPIFEYYYCIFVQS